jgi:N-acetylglutamate synthase-like GNAT family acetyltransferase
LQQLLQKNTSWGEGRSISDLRLMLRHSAAVVSVWQKRELIGFGRATSDFIYRAVLWDVVVVKSFQGMGVGKTIVQKLLRHHALNKVEKIYLMTTYQRGFYEQMGFEHQSSQELMLFKKNLREIN